MKEQFRDIINRLPINRDIEQKQGHIIFVLIQISPLGTKFKKCI